MTRRHHGFRTGFDRLWAVASVVTLLVAACSDGGPESTSPRTAPVVTTEPRQTTTTDMPSESSTTTDGESQPPSAGTTRPVSPAWESLSPVPTPRTEVTAVAAGGLIYVIGGFDADADTVAVVEIYDPASDTWSQGPPLPIAVNHAIGAALDGVVHVAGGYQGPGLRNPTDRVFALRDGEWDELSPMPEDRAAGGAAAAGGKLYVAGGLSASGLGRLELAADLLVYDPGERRWSRGPGPPTLREHLAVAGDGDRVYVLGGRARGLDSNLSTAEVFDPATGAWVTLPDVPTRRGGTSGGATESGLVAIAGGEAPSGTFDEVEVWDPTVEAWVSLPPMPTARHGLGVVAIGETIYVVAGGPTPGLSVSGANEAIDLSEL